MSWSIKAHQRLSGNRRYYAHLSRASRALFTPDGADGYRRSDEPYQRQSGTTGKFAFVRSLAETLPPGAVVLDLGCGTGRYFHCFTESTLIVGIDVSRPMLDRARDPVAGTRAPTALIEASLHDVAFRPGCFDAVYCMGVFGHSCPLDPFIAATIASWLTPTGVLYCDAVVRHLGRASHTWRSRLATWVAPYLRGAPQAYVEARLRRFTRSQDEVAEILRGVFHDLRMRTHMGFGGQREDVLCIAAGPRQ